MDGIPQNAGPIFDRLLGEELIAVRILVDQVGAYRSSVRESARKNDLVDLELAERLGAALEALIEESAGLGEEQRRLVQAAARYFVLSEDAEGDLESVLGFEDDAAVFNAVARHLGREDLMVRVT